MPCLADAGRLATVDSRGFYGAVGWTYARLDGGLGDTDSVTSVTGLDTSSGDDRSAGFNIATSVHMVDIETGWRYPLWRRWVARLARAAPSPCHQEASSAQIGPLGRVGRKRLSALKVRPRII